MKTISRHANLKRISLLLICSTCLLLGGLTLNSVLGQGDGQDVSRDSMRGLKGVRVVVEPLGVDAEKAGLEQATLQTDIELKLRQAGVPVLVKDEAFNTPLDSYLRVKIMFVKGRLWTSAYSISLQLSQPAKLANGSTCFAVTWTKGELGMISAGKIAGLRKNVSDLTDIFLNDFLAVNPR